MFNYDRLKKAKIRKITKTATEKTINTMFTSDIKKDDETMVTNNEHPNPWNKVKKRKSKKNKK